MALLSPDILGATHVYHSSPHTDRVRYRRLGRYHICAANMMLLATATELPYHNGRLFVDLALHRIRYWIHWLVPKNKFTDALRFQVLYLVRERSPRIAAHNARQPTQYFTLLLQPT
jgi:hypothetical protein